MEDLVIKTPNLVERCEDVITKHCKESYVPLPLVPFRTSRIAGSTSFVIAGDGSGTHYAKREDIHHGLSTGRSCEEVKEKQCYDVPQEKTVASQICKNMVTTIYIEECEPTVETEEVEKLISVDPVIEVEAPIPSGYLSFFLPFLVLGFGVAFLSVWFLSIWLGITFSRALLLILEPG